MAGVVILVGSVGADNSVPASDIVYPVLSGIGLIFVGNKIRMMTGALSIFQETWGDVSPR